MRTRLALIILPLAFTLSCQLMARDVREPVKKPWEKDRTFAILGINDVYRIAGLAGDRGGLHRVRALRAELDKQYGPTLMLHGGDFLSPSLLSRQYNGEQMVDILNRLDGDAQAVDPLMFAVFGNHEFDKSKMKHAAMLDSRVDESQFQWLHTNIAFKTSDDGLPLIDSPNLRTTSIVEVGGVKVGLFGLTIDSNKPAYVDGFADPVETARTAVAALREEGAEIVIGLTHLDLADDKALIAALGDEGPDLILGGHDHVKSGEEVDGRWVLKADADALTATVAVITLTYDGQRIVKWEHRPIGPTAPAIDADVNARIDHWTKRHAKEFCDASGEPMTCLDEVYTRTRTMLGGEEIMIRGKETSLGNLAADVALAHFADKGAQVAFINSGALRLNQNIPADSDIMRRHLEELFAFSAGTRMVEITGATLQRVIARSAQGHPGSGNWLQIAGFAFKHDPATGSVTELTLLTDKGPRRIKPEETILAVTLDYLVNPAIGDQDGYTMLKGDMVKAAGKDLKELTITALKAAGDAGIAPKVEGRICQGAGPCLTASE